MKNLFSGPRSMVIGLIVGFIISQYYQVSPGLAVFVTLLTSVFVGKLLIAFSMMQGAGYAGEVDSRSGTITQVCLSLFKMKPAAVVIFSAPIIIAVSMFILSFHNDPIFDHQDMLNYRALSVAALSSLLIALFHWIGHWKHYYYASEYDMRVMLKEKDHNPLDTEKNIQRLRDEGMFG